ncbi:MAG: hypothetical protein IJ333_09185 [Clostridia bacterium]|nr:hypothetical protein [Clostridia bacterium]
MKLFRSSLLMLAESAAFGWFILRDISFLAVLPLIPLGLLFCRLNHRFATGKVFWLNGICMAFSVVVTAFVAAEGLFEGKGLLTLLALTLAIGFIGLQIHTYELERISGWWMTAFLIVFIGMLLATLPGIRWRQQLPPMGDWKDILIFYLLAFSEPFSLGKDYRCAPLALGGLLVPFGIAAYLALGNGAFAMAEYPYLSVWSGVSISAFHHIEGIILSLYYGMGALRAAHFFGHFKDKISLQKVIN